MSNFRKWDGNICFIGVQPNYIDDYIINYN